MAAIVNIYQSGVRINELVCTTGDTIYKCLCAAGVIIEAPCGGNGRCGKCIVRLGQGGEYVLACRTIIEGDLDVYLLEKREMIIAKSSIDSASRSKAAQKHLRGLYQRLGVAVDVGTTTVVAHLIDIESGARLTTASGVNSQNIYGADVISRIQYCMDNGHETLTRIIREQLAMMINQMCASLGTDAGGIEHITIAANTVMAHLVAGYSPKDMGVVPFSPVSLFGEVHPVWDGAPASKNAKVYYTPAISSYVGGDITAGILATGLESIAGPAIFLDIGTNGEIVLKYNGKYYCCATAAGPAFEGAEISMGMAAVSGAVEHIKWERKLELSVIGDSIPRGICGSGLLDALAVLLEAGAVDETGRLLDPGEIKHDIASHIKKVNGENVFWLTKGANEISMTATDIRKLQLAKAAIAAGIQTLLSHTELEETQVSTFILAGGFGSFMDKHSAARIGLFPECFLAVTKALGNTAGEGAVITVHKKGARTTLENIRRHCEYIELSTSVDFNEQFVEQMTFPGCGE